MMKHYAKNSIREVDRESVELGNNAAVARKYRINPKTVANWSEERPVAVVISPPKKMDGDEEVQELRNRVDVCENQLQTM